MRCVPATNDREQINELRSQVHPIVPHVFPLSAPDKVTNRGSVSSASTQQMNSPGVEAEIPVIAVDIDGGDCRNTTGPPPPFLPHQARVVFARRDLQRTTILTVVDVQPDLVPPGNRGRLVARIRRESEG